MTIWRIEHSIFYLIQRYLHTALCNNHISDDGCHDLSEGGNEQYGMMARGAIVSQLAGH